MAKPKHIPTKGDRAWSDRKGGSFTVLMANAQRAVADLELIGKVAGKRHVARNSPFACIHPLEDSGDFSQTAAHVVNRATDKV